jgi:8-oxo-dGTP diphosphatase
MAEHKQKAFAYITHGDRLLVFRHVHHPEAGIQAPAGTVKDGEPPEAAVMREAFEETGLTELGFDCYLGEQTWTMAAAGREEIHHRRFYHLRCAGTPPEVWRHIEGDPSDSSAASYLFELYWVDLPHGVPELIAEHDALLPALFKCLALA